MWKYIIDTEKMEEIYDHIQDEGVPVQINSNEFATILVGLFDENLITFEE